MVKCMFFANIVKPEQYGRNQSESYPHKKPLENVILKQRVDGIGELQKKIKNGLKNKSRPAV
jgi:hypothetical protein